MVRKLELQSLIFPKKYWTLAQARKWLREHGYKSRGVDVKPTTYRFRQEDDWHFVRSSFRNLHWGKHILAAMAHRRIL